MINININTYDGRKYSLSIDKNNRGLELMKIMCDLEKCPIDDQLLYFNYGVVDSTKTLIENDITDESTIIFIRNTKKCTCVFRKEGSDIFGCFLWTTTYGGNKNPEYSIGHDPNCSCMCSLPVDEKKRRVRNEMKLEKEKERKDMILVMTGKGIPSLSPHSLGFSEFTPLEKVEPLPIVDPTIEPFQKMPFIIPKPPSTLQSTPPSTLQSTPPSMPPSKLNEKCCCIC